MSQNAITIDIDIEYGEYVDSPAFSRFRQKVLCMTKGFAPVNSVHIRRSSSGRVHIRVLFRDALPIIDRLAARAYLGDDEMRILCDLVRYYETRDEAYTDRCFDRKYRNGAEKKAGKWIEVDL